MNNQYFKYEYLLGINHSGYHDYLFSQSYRSLYFNLCNREKIIEQKSIAEIHFEGKPPIYQQFYPEPRIYECKPENRHIITIPEGVTTYFMEEKDKEIRSFIGSLVKNDSLCNELMNNIFNQNIEMGYIQMYETSIALFNNQYSIEKLSDYLYDKYLISGVLSSNEYGKLIATIKLLLSENIVLPIGSKEGFSDLMSIEINKIPVEKRKSNIIAIVNNLYTSSNNNLQKALMSNNYYDFFTLLYKANNEYLQILYLIEISNYSLPLKYEYNVIMKTYQATEKGITLICHLNTKINWFDIDEWVTFSEDINMYKRIEYIDSISNIENPVLPIFLAKILKKSIIVKHTKDTSIIQEKLNETDPNVDDIFIRYNLENIIKSGKDKLRNKEKLL